MRQKPGDAVTSVVPGSMCNPADEDTSDGLVAGVPVFDESTEEPFGLVLIDCDIDRILQRLLSKQMGCEEVAVLGGLGVLKRKLAGHIDDDAQGRDSSSLAGFEDAIAWLQTHSEYVDDGDANVYGTHVKLGATRNKLMFLLRQA